MPIEAIAYHLDRPLKKVVVLPSSDYVRGDGTKDPGTYSDFGLFATMVSTMIGDGPRVEIVSLADFAKHRWMNGVDFETAQEMVEALDSIYASLNEVYKDNEIMVDVTGGQKPPAVVGAAVALEDYRRFQYVSTRDYKIRSYDITYLPGRG
jgi:hypothetical protein